MRGTGYIVLIVVLFGITLTMCGKCPSVSINRANYEQHGVYYKGQLLSGVNDNRFVRLDWLSYGKGPKFDQVKKGIDDAWQEHKGSAKKMPRKFVLEIYPSMGSWISTGMTYALDSSNRVTYTILQDKIVGDKVIGQTEIILHGSGRYIICDSYRPGIYILITH